MKTPVKRSGGTRKGSSAKGAADASSRKGDGRAVAKTVRDWAKQREKKSPVDPAEGGSGQP